MQGGIPQSRRVVTCPNDPKGVPMPKSSGVPNDADSRSEPPALFDKAEAAEYLHTTLRHINRLWDERRLSGIKIGKFVRFSKNDLDTFCEANRVEAVR